MTDKKALADAYRVMMQMDAWRHLESWAKEEREASVNRVDSRSAADLNLNVVCEERGLRKGITKILDKAVQCSEGI